MYGEFVWGVYGVGVECVCEGVWCVVCGVWCVYGLGVDDIDESKGHLSDRSVCVLRGGKVCEGVCVVCEGVWCEECGGWVGVWIRGRRPVGRHR